MFLLSRVLYYGFIIPFSRLPFRVLYIISDCVYIVFFYLVGYRKKVVMSNLENSFPEKTQTERIDIAKKFYRHFCDLVVESLKIFTITEEQAQARVQYRNLNILDEYYDKGTSVVMGSGHYGNWEIAAITFDRLVKHQGIALYQPLTNKYLNSKMQSSRTKFGLAVMHIRKVKEEFERLRGELTTPVFLIDQSPSAHATPYWMTFLGQQTAMVTGLERYAREYNYPVVFMLADKPRRGYHLFTVQKVCDNPSETKPGEITEMTNRILEEEIRRRPELWLWTHRRWKRAKQEEA
jgi:KDO2-lipid IV(A) lauroyltransferase